MGAKDVEGQGSDYAFMDTLCLTEIEIIAFYSACHDLRVGWHLNLQRVKILGTTKSALKTES